jgi:tetratricopeptide (TPR) repeat protein
MDAAFRESVELELRCHYLLLEGKENTPECLAGEDRLTVLWENLDEVQRRSLNGMGSDLNWVRRHGEPPPKGRKQPDEVTPAEQQELVATIGSKEWHKTLHYLRLCAPMIPIVTLAYLRGRVYEAIGLPNYAGVFYEQAADLDPANAEIGLKALSTARPTNAVRRAEKVVASPWGYPPPVVALAATTVLRRDEADDRSSDRELFSTLLNDVVKRLQLEPANEVRTVAYQAAASGFEIIGDVTAALRCLDEGLKVSPDNHDLLVFKGLLLYATETDKAVESFAKLTQTGTRSVWPYAFLAHYHLLNRNYGASLEMGREAWARATTNRLRAQLLEWQAICLTELRYPPEVVRPIFEKAISLDPSNIWIGRNLDAFSSAVTQAREPEWQIEEASLLRASRADSVHELEAVGAS